MDALQRAPFGLWAKTRLTARQLHEIARSATLEVPGIDLHSTVPNRLVVSAIDHDDHGDRAFVILEIDERRRTRQIRTPPSGYWSTPRRMFSLTPPTESMMGTLRRFLLAVATMISAADGGADIQICADHHPPSCHHHPVE